MLLRLVASAGGLIPNSDDAAWGENLSTKATSTLVSLGVGADATLTDNLTGGLTIGRAMTDAGETRAGDWMVNASIKASF